VYVCMELMAKKGGRKEGVDYLVLIDLGWDGYGYGKGLGWFDLGVRMGGYNLIPCGFHLFGRCVCVCM
jgi:hypothetical protein